jgi:hypothetical protein
VLFLCECSHSRGKKGGTRTSASSSCPFRSLKLLSGWMTLARHPSSHEVGLLFRGSRRTPVGPYSGFDPPPAAFLGSWGLSGIRPAPCFYTRRSPLLSFGLLFRVWPEAAAAAAVRSRQAPLGFRPLQRTELRKSTCPGFPSPGLFPSRRFSRPQGFAPSETARACSIPQPLLGFRLQSPPFGSNALSGRPVVLHAPPVPTATRRKRPAIGAARRSGTPKGAVTSRSTDEQSDSPSPASVPFGRRSGPPQRQGPHGGANLVRACLSSAVPGKPSIPAWLSRRPPEGGLRSSRAGADRRSARPEGRWLFEGSEPRSNTCNPSGGMRYEASS